MVHLKDKHIYDFLPFYSFAAAELVAGYMDHIVYLLQYYCIRATRSETSKCESFGELSESLLS